MLITKEQYDSHFDALINSGVACDNLTPLAPVCPICLHPFSNERATSVATKEDAPPQSLGGTKVALTCKKCNNSAGRDIDIHLVNLLKHLDQRSFHKGSTRRVRIYDGSEIVNGLLTVGDNKELTLEVLKKINDSRKLPNILSQWKPEKDLSFSNQKLKLSEKNLNAAILKTAYILLYSKLGYSVLLWDEYNQIREQIQNPDLTIVPPLWTMQNLGIKDGIYYSNECWLRGFFVVFSVTNQDTQKKRQITVLLPAPQSDFQVANYFLSKIQPGDRLRIGNITNIDFLTCSQNINQLNQWAYGKSLLIYVST